jgi:hypothetical protein
MRKPLLLGTRIHTAHGVPLPAQPVDAVAAPDISIMDACAEQKGTPLLYVSDAATRWQGLQCHAVQVLQDSHTQPAAAWPPGGQDDDCRRSLPFASQLKMLQLHTRLQIGLGQQLQQQQPVQKHKQSCRWRCHHAAAVSHTRSVPPHRCGTYLASRAVASVEHPVMPAAAATFVAPAWLFCWRMT